MARAKKVIQKAASVGKKVASLFPISKPVTAVSAVASLRSKKKGRRKQTVASIKRKIALLKAKKELAKVRGY